MRIQIVTATYLAYCLTKNFHSGVQRRWHSLQSLTEEMIATQSSDLSPKEKTASQKQANGVDEINFRIS
jgi:hypothetical protein